MNRYLPVYMNPTVRSIAELIRDTQYWLIAIDVAYSTDLVYLVVSRSFSITISPLRFSRREEHRCLSPKVCATGGGSQVTGTFKLSQLAFAFFIDSILCSIQSYSHSCLFNCFNSWLRSADLHRDGCFSSL